jgi:TonB-dependent SusC/RagA subfamily outer membrane receptor
VISGTVKSEQGQLLQGANVFITEMNVSVGSNQEGVYRITLAPERVRGQTVTLRVRAIGFQPQQRQITLTAGSSTQDFTLRIDINKLSEVVVTGVTGATEAKKLAFTVSKVDVAELTVPGTSALSSLQGRVAGATVVVPSGRPGTSPVILLRGPKSINAQNRSQSPLVIIDGVVSTGSIGDLNPQDIESIEVVKGAAASSTYGSRAGNGVIQITTKSGRTASQGARFNFRTEYGVSDIAQEYPFSQRHMILMDPTNNRMCIVQTGYPACSRSVDF